MALPDRAQNVLPLLITEPGLRSGDIIFVAHSLGGLVVEQILRLAQVRAPYDQRAQSFLRRVRRIVFIGTPHAGSDLATIGNAFKALTRPRPTQEGLSRNDAYLRDLNSWFRGFIGESEIEILVLRETKSMPILTIPYLRIPLIRNFIVKPDSADPGLPPSTMVIPVDEDHSSIVAPVDRNQQVYRQILAFSAEPITKIHPASRLEAGIERIGGLLSDQGAGLTEISTNLASNADAINKTIEDLRDDQNAGFRELQRSLIGGDINLVSEELERRLSVLRKIRFVPDFEPSAECTLLFNEALTGELRSSNAQVKRRTFAWCARILAVKDPSQAALMLREADKVGSGSENIIAKAIISATNPQSKSEAWALLSAIDNRESRTAALAVATINSTSQSALNWVKEAGLTIDDFDADGKLSYLLRQVDAEHWDEAFNDTRSISEEDIQTSPVLYIIKALIFLAQTVNPSLRQTLLYNIPFDSKRFPLAMEERALSLRRQAIVLYKAGSLEFSKMGRTKYANMATDYALWLSIRDPSTEKTALAELEASMRDKNTSLRRLAMALDYDLSLDLAAVEREIERETALTGGKSVEAAFARLAFAHTKATPADAAAYIERHRIQLAAHLNWDAVVMLQAEMLARAGDIAGARGKIGAVTDREIQKDAIARLERVIAEAGGANVVNLREEQYLQTKSLADLSILAIALKDSKSWEKLIKYGKILFEETKDIPHAEYYVNALYEMRKDDELIGFLGENPDLLSQSELMMTFSSRARYRQGDLREAKAELDILTGRRNVVNDRILLVNILIASGNWSALGTFVEEEWAQRSHRTAEELLRAGQLAHRVGLGVRGKDLISEAARKAEGNATILVGCYSAATSAGWESDDVTHEWFQQAIANSGEDGPVRSVGLQELVDMQPGWNERHTKTSNDLVAARIPMFIAGTLVNQSLLQMHLIGALSNLGQRDARRRVIIPTFSGARTSRLGTTVNTLALDPSTLLTLALIEKLDHIISCYEAVYIAHTTLGWLFQESQRVEYHQPSRVRDALRIKRMLDNGLLHRFERALEAPADLEAEVGEELASLIIAAKSATETGIPAALVVRPYPIPKPGSFMNDAADISG